MIDHIADASKMVADNPGVQGLARLGRNAIERVAELELCLHISRQSNKELRAERDALKLRAEQAEFAVEHAESDLAAAVAERNRLRDSDAFSRKELARGNEIIDSLRIERDALRARIAAIDAAPTVAWLSIDCIGERYLLFSRPDDNDPIVELIARPAKEGM